jgi:hypothetical protein
VHFNADYVGLRVIPIYRTRWQRLFVTGAALSILLLVVLFAAVRGFPYLGGGSGSMTYGQPETGKSLAAVHVGAKTIYFPGVLCQSTDPGIVAVSLGVHDDPVSFYLAAFLGPLAPDGQYLAPGTVLVVGHRPGVSFDQSGSGSLKVSPDLQRQLQATRPSATITVGTLSFSGTDSSRAELRGTVNCSTGH